MRYPEVDKYIESLFGKPDYAHQVLDINRVLTPFPGTGLFREDPIISNHSKAKDYSLLKFK